MKKNGFTLIELLVIIALVGVISTVGVITYTKISKAQKDKLKDANIALIETAAVKYGEANKEQVKEGNKALTIENKELTETPTGNSLTVTVEVLKYLGYIDEKNEGIEEIKDSEKILLYIDNNKVKAKYAGSAFNFSIKQTNKERQKSEAEVEIEIRSAENENKYKYSCEIEQNERATIDKLIGKDSEEINGKDPKIDLKIQDLSRGVNLITGRTPNSHILTCTVASLSAEGEEEITLTKTTKIYTKKETELNAPEAEVKKGDEDYKEEWSKEPVCIKLKEEGTKYTYDLFHNGVIIETNMTLDDKICFGPNGTYEEDGIYEIEIGGEKNGFSANEKGYAIIKIDTKSPKVPTIKMNKWKSNDQNSRPNLEKAQITGFLGEVYTEGKWSNRSIYAEASSTDATSGIDYYLYTATGKTKNATDEKLQYRNVESEGTSYVKFKACDKAGNCSDYSPNKQMDIDKTAPIIKASVTIHYPTPSTTYEQEVKNDIAIGGWFNYELYKNDAVNVTLTATDDLSMLSTREWKYNNANLTTFADTGMNNNIYKSEDLKGKNTFQTNTGGTLSQDGYRKGIYTVTDQAGNVATFIVKAYVDKTAPTCTSSGGSYSWSTSQTITGTCYDSMSKCKGNVSKTYTKTTQTTVSPGNVYDNAGNYTTCTQQAVRVDKTAPKLECKKGDYSNICSNCNYKITCTDSHSGCKPYTAGTIVNGSRYAHYSNSTTLTKQDKVGNVGSCSINGGSSGNTSSKKSYYKFKKTDVYDDKYCTLHNGPIKLNKSGTTNASGGSTVVACDKEITQSNCCNKKNNCNYTWTTKGDDFYSNIQIESIKFKEVSQKEVDVTMKVNIWSGTTYEYPSERKLCLKKDNRIYVDKGCTSDIVTISGYGGSTWSNYTKTVTFKIKKDNPKNIPGSYSLKWIKSGYSEKCPDNIEEARFIFQTGYLFTITAN